MFAYNIKKCQLTKYRVFKDFTIVYLQAILLRLDFFHVKFYGIKKCRILLLFSFKLLVSLLQLVERDIFFLKKDEYIQFFFLIQKFFGMSRLQIQINHRLLSVQL